MLEERERELWTKRWSSELKALEMAASSEEEEVAGRLGDMAGLGGRISGSEAWRRQRGELGATKGKSYDLRDFRLFYSGENPPDENAFCLFDRRKESKWLDFGFVQSGTSYVRLEFPQPKILVSYVSPLLLFGSVPFSNPILSPVFGSRVML